MQFCSKVLCLAGVCALTAAAATEPVLVEEIIAKVNGDIITRSELDRDRKVMETELKARGAAGVQLQQQLKERIADILRERIDGMLLVQKGKELGISVDSDVSKQIADMQLKSGINDTEKFHAWVREQAGMPFEDYKNEMRNYFLRQRVLREMVGRNITIPRADLEKYYKENQKEFVREEQVFLREIFLSTEGKSATEASGVEKKAKDLSARARKGERFTELARQHSDSQTKENFGELGGFKRGDLDKQIVDLIWNQDRGYVTDPIKRGNGYLILRVDEKHKAGQASFEEVENEIMERLYMPKFQPGVRTLLTDLRRDAFLEIKPGYVDTGAAPGKNTAWSDPAQLKPETVTKEEVANRARRRRLLGMVPLPGTAVAPKAGTSSSK
ncbi:MAG TPA: peptidylprolyl isomerase [Bryobacteraceae bacterium]|nr:peptidylprolyl isomerase [Bryobacteraceae bacterium]